MGVSAELSARLLANHHYTPIDMAAMVAALDSMKGVEDRALFFARAAQAKQRFIAFFMRRRAELLADDYRRHGGYVRFVALAGYPFVAHPRSSYRHAGADRCAVLDRGDRRPVSASDRRAQGVAPKARGELRLTGQATASGQAAAQAEGWAVRERQ